MNYVLYGCICQFFLVDMKADRRKKNLKTRKSFISLYFCATAKPHRSPHLVSIEMALLLI